MKIKKFKWFKPQIETINALGFAIAVNIDPIDTIRFESYNKYDLVLVIGFVLITINLISVKQ
jgi:hypothetical protein